MIASPVRGAAGEVVLPDVSQHDLARWVSEREAVLATFWRPFCFMVALTPPGTRAIVRAHEGRLVGVRILLADGEAPDAAWKIGWVPATVLFVDGAVRGRWYGGDVPWRRVERRLGAYLRSKAA